MKAVATPQGALCWITERRDYMAMTALAQNKATVRRFSTPYFIMQIHPTATADAAWRVGFTTSRKVGSAVVRNRARRRLRELVRGHLPGLMQPGFDIVIIGKTAAAAAPFPHLVTALTDAVARLKVAA